jgi:hypothetical protein
MAPVQFQTVFEPELEPRPPNPPDVPPGRLEQQAQQPPMDNARHMIPIKIIECFVDVTR